MKLRVTCQWFIALLVLSAAPHSIATSEPNANETKAIRNIAYGEHSRQRFDVYALPKLNNAPVIFMVHGGGWRHGSKDAGGVVDQKVARWVPKGIVFISTDYRLLPDATPIEQARDVARALATAQRKASEWGADPKQFVLMGHSAGAHLVALLAASPALLREQGALPPIGTVSLDSAALDVVSIMDGPHLGLYDAAFGKDRNTWIAASPLHALQKASTPFLGVCSSKRFIACPQARKFTDKFNSLGGRGSVLPQALSHGEINHNLGQESAYTTTVEDFLSTLSPDLHRLLQPSR